MKYFLFVLLFVAIVTVSGELLINQQSSTLLTTVAVAIIGISFYFLIYKPIQKLFK